MPKVKFVGYVGEPAEIQVNHAMVQTSVRAFKLALKRDPVIKGHEGATDMRVLIKSQIPTICFGPGTITQMHAINEWVKVEDVIRATKVLALLILLWTGVEL